MDSESNEKPSQTKTIRNIVQTPYEERSNDQHQIIHTILAKRLLKTSQQTINKIQGSIVPLDQAIRFSKTKVKLLQFYAQITSGEKWLTNKQYPTETIFISGINNAGTNYLQQKLIIITGNTKVYLQAQKHAIFLLPKSWKSCLSFSEPCSIENEINFMLKNEYFASVLKKRYYSILESSHILKYSYSQVVYDQDEPILGSQNCVYLVREGDFAYAKYSAKQQKKIQIMKFGQGHLFGILQILNKVQQRPTTPIIRKRQFTVKCCSSYGIVYKIPQEIFNHRIKPFCQKLIHENTQTLQKYLANFEKKMQNSRQPHNDFISASGWLAMKRSNSVGQHHFQKNIQKAEGMLLPSLKTRISFFEPIAQTSRVKKQNKSALFSRIGKTTNPSNNFEITLFESKTSRQKRNSKYAQKQKLAENDFKEFEGLHEKKIKFGKVKQLMGPGCGKSKNQILLGMFKSSWQFEKDKKQKNRAEKKNN